MKKNGQLTTSLLVVIFFAGLSLLLYPSISDYWNSMHQSKAINIYSKEVASMSEEEYDAFLQAAVSYNQNLLNRRNPFLLSDEEREMYSKLLDISGNGVMGYIEIPTISVTLPIYHGTSDMVLQIAAGHLDWTSLPVGGKSSHCVLSGHRGLPSAKLFTNLDKLVLGDSFMIRILDEVLTYEVDQILIVEPDDTQALQIVEDEDYCTLVTCTPYGINTHRLLVRGHRIENVKGDARVVSEAIVIDELIVALAVLLPVLLVLLMMLMLRKPEKKIRRYK